VTARGRADDRDAVSTLLARYCSTMDRRDADGWAALFTADGQFFAFGRSFDGHDRLRRLAAESPLCVHLASGPVVALDGDEATVQQNFVFVYADDHHLRIGFYDDVLVRTDDGWRFRTRRCTFQTADGPSDRP
jgi:SnoaL-like domain